jgi:hypothetical protein
LLWAGDLAMAAGQEAPPPAALREGRGWLYRVRGRSPARGEEIVIYVLFPELLPPDPAGRAATMLSGDPQFEREEAWAERLPFPARGFVLVELEEGHVHSGIPDEVRVRRRLEEYRAR